MKNRLMIFTITMVVFCGGGVTSCTQEPNLAKEPLNLDPHHISVSEAIETMESAISELYGVSATRSFQGYKVETLKGADMQNPATRSADEEPFPEDLLYVVNFENENGFAVLAADDRLDPILCITEAGSLSVSDIIGDRGTTDGSDGLGGGIPFKPKPDDGDDDEGDPDEGEGSDTTGFGKPIEPGDIIGGIIGGYLDTHNYYEPDNGEKTGDGFGNDNTQTVVGGTTGGGATDDGVPEEEKVGPFLVSKWDQSEPYNEMCPSDGDGGNRAVGCVAVALAQIMAYHGVPELRPVANVDLSSAQEPVPPITNYAVMAQYVTLCVGNSLWSDIPLPSFLAELVQANILGDTITLSNLELTKIEQIKYELGDSILTKDSIALTEGIQPSYYVHKKITWKDIVEYNYNNTDYLSLGLIIGNKYITNRYDSLMRANIAYLMRWIGAGVDMGYNSNGSLAWPWDAQAFLIDQGYESTDWPGWDNGHRDLIVTHLKSGRPVMMTSISGLVKGHAWVIDGFYRRDKTIYFHCNWGWAGNGDGYYLSGVFDTEKQEGIEPDSDDSPKTGNQYNYDAISRLITARPK